MIVDTSAIIAILRDEPDADVYVKAIAAAWAPRISAGTYIEAAIVVDVNRDPVLSGRFDDRVREAGLRIEPVTEQQARLARRAYRDFGKGSGPPAGLNCGDCFADALARTSGERLLFMGDDFSHTDVSPAVL